MDNSNWRPTQGVSGGPVGDPSMESGDWRVQLQPDSRQRIVNKIMETLKRHLPLSGHEGLQELNKIAVRFEEKIYTAATSQSDYLRKISLKMLTMETRSQNPIPDPMQANSGLNPTDPGSQVMPQVNIQGQQLPIPVPSQSGQQQMMPQNMQNNIGSTGMQGSSSFSAALPTVSGLSQSTMSNVAGQNSNLQNMQNMSAMQQGSVGNTMGANNFANQRQIPGRQQLVPQQQQQQQQNPNSHYLYQQQLQQMAKQKLQQNNINPAMQSQMQQQQQNLLQSGMQPTMMQTPSLAGVVQNQQAAVPQSSQPLLNHQQSVLRQQQRQQQVQPTQQQVQPTQSNPMGQQANATNMQQNQLMGQQSNYSDMQQQRLLGQQNKLSSVQQPQQHLIGQHNNLSGMQQHHLGSQSNASGQQQLLGSQSGNTGMQTNQHSVQQMLPSKMPIQQQNQQSSATMLPTQVQQSQPQLQQHVMPQMQSQSGQLQQQMGRQQQPNLLQRDMQQRLPTAGGFQQQNVIDQQKLYQQQRAMPEASSTSLDSTDQTRSANGVVDWQEEVYQKIKAMKDLYLHDLHDMHQKILGKLQHHDSLPQQPKNEQLEKLKVFKNMLERFMAFLQIPKQSILANYKDKLGTYEKQIVNVINSNRRKPGAPQQQGQALPPQHMQSQQQHSQSHDNQMSSQMQTGNMQGSMGGMQQNNMGSMQQNSVSSLQGSANPQQNMMNSMQPSSNLDQVQNSSMNSLQQVSGGSLQQNAVSGGQQVNINPMVSHSGMGTLKPNSNMLQHQHIKQQEQLLQSQQLKQFQRADASYFLSFVASLDSTDQTRSANGVVDWQEVVYQKIKAMKDLYLHDLNDMHQKILGKLQHINHALVEEIKEINRGLIDTVVNISEEDADPAAVSEGGDGTVVKCSFTAVALGPNLKSQYASAQMSPIQPLRLLVPANYPNCSPILLDKFPAEVRLLIVGIFTGLILLYVLVQSRSFLVY